MEEESTESYIPITKPDIRNEDIDNVVDVLHSGMLVQGKIVLEVEQKLSQILDVKNAVLVSNGTASLHLALLAYGIGPGDEVIVPAFSYIATANVVELVGAKPVFVDIDIDSFNIDVNKIEDAVTENTKAIIPVHEFGYPADLIGIKAIAFKHSLLVIEDAACALGARAGDQAVGTIGDIGSFSFHPRKAITSGEGGVLITNDSKIGDYFRSMRNHGSKKDSDSIEYNFAGFNYRMTDIQAALLLLQVTRLHEYIADRENIASRYLEEISCEQVILPKIPKYGRHSWQSYHVLFDSENMRNRFIQYANRKGIQSSLGAQCIPIQKYYKQKYGYIERNFPMAYKAYTCGAVLPLYSNMPYSFVNRTIEALNKFKREEMN